MPWPDSATTCRSPAIPTLSTAVRAPADAGTAAVSNTVPQVPFGRRAARRTERPWAPTTVSFLSTGEATVPLIPHMLASIPHSP